MKKVLPLILFFLILLSVAVAENVTQLEYTLIIHGVTLSGYYTGEIVNEKPEGYGIFETQVPNGTACHYVGEWRGGIMHGKGAMYWNDGSLEIGEYEDGTFVSGKYNYNGLKLLVANREGEETVNPYWFSKSTRLVQQDNTELTVMYIGNKNSHVFHRLDCDSVRTMKEKNKVEFYSREEAIDNNYTPCNRCSP